jgi:AbrB family looped-hinge helix DNA binding protein
MNKTSRELSVIFSTRGQVVIPRRIRKEFGIEEGTRAMVTTEQGMIILKPVTHEYVRSFRGIFKSKAGGKPATRELLESRSDDSRREEGKIEKHRS